MTPAEFRARLTLLGRSQRGLARELGIDVMTVNRWAVGKARVPVAVALLLQSMRPRGIGSRRPSEAPPAARKS